MHGKSQRKPHPNQRGFKGGSLGRLLPPSTKLFCGIVQFYEHPTNILRSDRPDMYGARLIINDYLLRASRSLCMSSGVGVVCIVCTSLFSYCRTFTASMGNFSGLRNCFSSLFSFLILVVWSTSSDARSPVSRRLQSTKYTNPTFCLHDLGHLRSTRAQFLLNSLNF